MMKKLVIAGANGFLGRYLSRWFLDCGWEVVGLSRGGGVAEGVTDLRWDGRTLGEWAASLDGAEVLVNLAGRSVNCRYHEKNRKLIMDSRVESTSILGEAIRACEKPPKLWMNSSTATIYRHAEDGPQSELEGEIGTGFSVGIARAWEEAFFKSHIPGEVRKIALRSSMVIANEPGTVYDYLYKISQLGLGGAMAGGRQRVSWIHIADFCQALEWFIENPRAEGVYNVTAPGPEENREVMRQFREIAGRGFGLPAARWMLEVGTFVMRTEAEMVTKSRWVVPTRLLAEGFVFQWPELGGALRDLKKWPEFSVLER